MDEIFDYVSDEIRLRRNKKRPSFNDGRFNKDIR